MSGVCTVCSSPHPELDKLSDEADVLDAVLDLTRRFLPQEVPAHVIHTRCRLNILL